MNQEIIDIKSNIKPYTKEYLGKDMTEGSVWRTERHHETFLPKKLWKLLALGVYDMKEIMKNPDYEFYMHEWHEPVKVEGRDICKVCMAGAVLANTLGYLKNMPYNCKYVSLSDINCIDAIDYMLRDCFEEAFRLVNDKRWDDINHPHKMYLLSDEFKKLIVWDWVAPYKNIEAIERVIKELKERDL